MGEEIVLYQSPDGSTRLEVNLYEDTVWPFLLLALLDLVHRDVITAPFIAVTSDLVELNELFNLYWRRIIPLSQTSSIWPPHCRTPFRYLVSSMIG
jgi:hypothetical protein